jgi:hypothetical protein
MQNEKVLVIHPRDDSEDFTIEIRQNGKCLFQDRVDVLNLSLLPGENFWVREYLGANYHPMESQRINRRELRGFRRRFGFSRSSSP